MKVKFTKEILGKVYYLDKETEQMILLCGRKSISENELESDDGDLTVEPFSFLGEQSYSLGEAVEEIEPELKVKPNPVYIPKHIARRRKW